MAEWLKGCEICNAGLCARFDELIDKGMSQRKAAEVLEGEQEEKIGAVVYPANTLRQRYKRNKPSKAAGTNVPKKRVAAKNQEATLFQIGGATQIIELKDGSIRWKGIERSVSNIVEGPCWIEGRVLVLLHQTKKMRISEVDQETFYKRTGGLPYWDRTEYYTERLYLTRINKK